jgi:hypothetical protein
MSYLPIQVNHAFPKHRTTWDYKGWEVTSDKKFHNLETQDDWNNTLLSKIHEISCKIHYDAHSLGANTIVVNPTFKHLLETTSYFNSETNIFSASYKVIYDDTIPHNRVIVKCDRYSPTPISLEDIDGANKKTYCHVESPFFMHLVDDPNLQAITNTMLVGEITVENYSHIGETMIIGCDPAVDNSTSISKIYHIDVGGIPDDQAAKFVEEFKKTILLDPLDIVDPPVVELDDMTDIEYVQKNIMDGLVFPPVDKSLEEKLEEELNKRKDN